VLCACDILEKRGRRHDIIVVLIITAHFISEGGGRQHNIIVVLISGDKVNYLHQLGAPGGRSPKDLVTGEGGGLTELDLASH
jgi:hypothetical protein